MKCSSSRPPHQKSGAVQSLSPLSPPSLAWTQSTMPGRMRLWSIIHCSQRGQVSRDQPQQSTLLFAIWPGAGFSSNTTRVNIQLIACPCTSPHTGRSFAIQSDNHVSLALFPPGTGRRLLCALHSISLAANPLMQLSGKRTRVSLQSLYGHLVLVIKEYSLLKRHFALTSSGH